MASVEAYIVVRRYDKAHEDSTSAENITSSPPQLVNLPSELGFADLKSQIRAFVGLDEDGSEVIKLRREDGTLLPFSFLLEGNTMDNPYIVDVTRVNQSATASPRSALPLSYATTVRGKLATLERRIERVESLVPELQSRRQVELERTIHQLGSKVNFLDRRVDELVPLDWKQHLQLTST